jgi:sigma-B regulation protein RsbU (phosphoserine phosphatase)
MKKKILVVDDDDSIIKLMKRILSTGGYAVYTATNGLEAISLLETKKVDLIMLDMMMPVMDGIQFLKSINESRITFAPVLMVSGCTDVNQRLECYKLGVYDFIGKPEHTEVILKRVENGLNIGEMLTFNKTVKDDLVMANKLQSFLFPRPWISTGDYDIFALNIPVAEIGGDLFDFVHFEDGSLIFFVSDVSGHGISAAIFTAIVKMVFRNAVKETQGPGEIMSIMNREIAAIIPNESFVTMFCGFYQPSTQILHYANAGHPMPYLLEDGVVYELDGNGPFLGPISEVNFVNYTRDVSNSSGMIVYTDGVVDIADEKENMIGRRILFNMLNARNLSTFENFHGIYKKFIEKQNVSIIDDCTILLLNFNKK